MINQDKKVSLKLNHELFEKLEWLARKNDRTLSSMIRIILKEYLDEEGLKNG
jgi:predicted DNA-binding protein